MLRSGRLRKLHSRQSGRRGGFSCRADAQPQRRPEPDDTPLEGVALVLSVRSRLRQQRSARDVARLVQRLRMFRTPGPEEAAAIEAEKKRREEGDGGKDDALTAVAWTAFAAAAAATALRLGGRAALLSGLGLGDLQEGGEVKQSVDALLAMADGLGAWKYVAFLGGWVVTKVTMVDALGLPLAFGAGVLFGGVWQGTLLSATGATLGSSAAFGLARTVLRDRVEPLVKENAGLRAVERSVAKEGFKTVLTLRLAPLVPVPIGTYNYAYGVTTVGYPQFAAGIFLGSIKPYFIDAYLGVFGKAIVDGDDSADDALLVVAFAAVLFVGTLASQLAARTWEEVQSELAAEEAAAKGLSPEDGVPAPEPDGLSFLSTFNVPKDSGWRAQIDLSWARLWRLVLAENAALAKSVDAAVAAGGEFPERGEEPAAVVPEWESFAHAPGVSPLTAYFLESNVWSYVLLKAI